MIATVQSIVGRGVLLAALPLLLAVAGCRSTRCTTAEAFGNLGGDVNSPFDDYAPWLVDSTNLVFTSDRVESEQAGLRELLAERRPAALYRTLRLNEKFDPAIRYGIYDDDQKSVLTSVAPLRRTTTTGIVAIGVICDEEAGRSSGGCDLVYVGGSSASGRVLPPEGVNSSGWEGHPHPTEDGARLWFASDRPGGFGGSDIWYLEQGEDGLWGSPINAGARVNTAGNEISPAVDPQTGDLYFAASDADGSFDIVRLRTGKTKREPLAPPVNSLSSEITPFILGDDIYLSSDRPGGCGGLDLYRFPIRR